MRFLICTGLFNSFKKTTINVAKTTLEESEETPSVNGYGKRVSNSISKATIQEEKSFLPFPGNGFNKFR